MVANPDNRTGESESLNPLQELHRFAEGLESLYQRGQGDEISRPLEDLKSAAEETAKASSGSWLGYHANVYYRDLQPPPPGGHFNSEWGMARSALLPSSSADWVVYNPEDVVTKIYERAGNPNLEPARAFDLEAKRVFQRSKRDLASILEIAQRTSTSEFLAELKQEAETLSPVTQGDFVERLGTQQTISFDRIASSQGHWMPPHFSVLSEVWVIQHTTGILTLLAEIIRQTETHLTRQGLHSKLSNSTGSRVFIGHGHSNTWRELKDFIEDQLGLPVDEFNRVPTAGVPITDRLSEMVGSAAIAFLVMTGEDEQPTGELRPRENVVHEAGLFQGRLGFQRAIVLLEDGCEKFSNNAGLVHIPFSGANIRAAFQDIREVLEREGVLNQGATT